MKTYIKTVIACTLGSGLLASTNPSFANTRTDGSFLNQITNAYVTPHLNWGKPLSGGPLKVLFIVPRSGAREVVELGQRVEIAPQSFVTYNSTTLARDDVYEALVQGTSTSEKTHELLEKVQGNYQAIVLANVDFNILPPQAQYEILKQVSKGAGLLMVYPRILPNLKMLAHSTDGASHILQNVDITALPGEAEKNRKKNLVESYRFGQGRIATITYPSGSNALGLTAYQPYNPSVWKARYENNLALVGRALQWTAGRDTSAAVTPLWPTHIKAGEKVLLPLQIQNAPEGKVLLRLRDSWNTVQWRKEITIHDDKLDNVILPAMEAGTHFLDVRLMKNNVTTAFGVFQTQIDSPVNNFSLSTNKDFYEVKDTITIKVLLQRSLTTSSTVKIRLEDLPYRKIWAEQTIEIKSGVRELHTTFPASKIPTLAGTIVAQIWQKKVPIIKAEHVVYFPHRDREVFPEILWNSIPPVITEMYAGQIIDRLHAPAGLNHPQGDGSVAHLSAMMNQRFVPYMTRIGLSNGPQGQTLNNHWLGITTEEAKEATNGDGSIYNPAVRALWKEAIRRRIKDIPLYGPLVYSLGDENGFSYDAGYSLSDNVEFHKFLQTRYGTIQKLNQEWGTNYTHFTEATHFSPDELREKHSFPAWYDHRCFIEKEYADVHHFLAQTIKQIDPHALVGAEGSEPGNLEYTIKDLDFWGPYSNAVMDELLRSIGGDRLRTLWWGYGESTVGSKGYPYRLWRPLLQGVVNGSAFFTSGFGPQGMLSVDLSFAGYYKKLLPQLDSLKNGQAQLLIKSPLRNDGIAVLWSHASYSASFMDNRFFNPTDSMTAFADFCYRQGLNFDYVTSQMMARGVLKGYKVLFLFGASALSDTELGAINDFTAHGGIVIADINPGILNGYLRPLKKSSMADYFGIPSLNWQPHLTTKPVNVNTRIRKKQFSFSATKAFQSPEVPIFTTKEHKKGLSVLLNFNLGTAQRTASSPKDFDHLLLSLLSLNAIKPAISVSGISLDQLIIRLRHDGDGQVLGILASQENIGKTMTLHLPRSCWVYEVNKGFIGHNAQIKAIVDIPFKLYAIFTKEQRAPQFILDKSSVKKGFSVEVGSTNFSASGIYRLDMFAPSGAILPRRTKVFTGHDAVNVHTIPFAFNDSSGTYRIVLTDVRTGLHSDHPITVLK